MKKKSAISKSTAPAGYRQMIHAITGLHEAIVGRVAAATNRALVLRNWIIGAYIVEFEQLGADRARYGDELLPSMATDLTAKGVPGCSRETLGRMRVLYTLYPQIGDVIRSSAMTEFTGFLPASIRSSLMTKIAAPAGNGKSLRPCSAEEPSPLSAEVILHLSWTKLQELIRQDDPWKRAFYENECLKANWSVRQLRRQIESLLYERTGLSTNKKAVIERARKQEPQETIADLIRDPYILEFTGLAERPEYYESDLEGALLTHLQSFLLELGAGFCFEARQKRITVGRTHDYIDLVFYHRRLRCHVLIDLKIRAFKHADAGQMNFYLNWWKAHGMDEGDNPPVGIILCSDREQAAVEFATAGMDQKLFVSRYLVALPSAEKLRAFLEADRDRIEAAMVRSQPAKKRPASRAKSKMLNLKS